MFSSFNQVTKGLNIMNNMFYNILTTIIQFNVKSRCNFKSYKE